MVARPQNGSSSATSVRIPGRNTIWKCWPSKDRGKQEQPNKNHLEQGGKPTAEIYPRMAQHILRMILT